MERVTFIVSDTGIRIGCLLNPEHLVQRRQAGLRRPMAGSGQITGAALSDDLLLHTGGGRTEVDLDLLFDVTLTHEQPAMTDVRQLTRPLWDLAENRDAAQAGSAMTGGSRIAGGSQMTTVRFVWGKAWNLLAVVESVAERLERFDSGGTPTRSWLRMRLRRVPDAAVPSTEPAAGSLPVGEELTRLAQAAEPQDIHTALGPGVDANGESTGGERLDELAARYYGGRAWLWRLIAEKNGLTTAPFVPTGAALIIPEVPTQVTR